MIFDEKHYIEAFKLCGNQLQACLDELEGRRYAWHKVRPSRPSFADLIFAVGNRIYAVLLAKVENAHGQRGKRVQVKLTLGETERNLLLEESRRFNLEPVYFPLWEQSMAPLSMGWNLLSPVSGDMMDPAEIPDLPGPVPMSEWELCNFRVSVVINDLKKRNREILSYQDIPQVHPNIWFRDEQGNPSWISVTDPDSSAPLPDPVEFRRHLPDSPSDIPGYIARVGIKKTDPSSDPTPCRGDAFFISYKGMDRI